MFSSFYKLILRDVGGQQKWLEDHPVWGNRPRVFLDELILVEKRLLMASQDNLPETKRSLGGWPGPAGVPEVRE